MKIDFPYPGFETIPPVEVPDANLMGVYAPAVVDNTNEEETLAAGFAKPYDTPRLRDSLQRNDRVLILFDDATRPTPAARLLAFVADELKLAGIPDHQVLLLAALGTHRPMTGDELQQKLGLLHGRFAVHQHDWQDTAALHHFGYTRDGTSVTANRLLAQADFIVGLGSITPHRVTGFSGGATIAIPGVSGKEMLDRIHWEASMQMAESVMGVPENSMRLRIEEAARIVRLRYIANTVADRNGTIIGCFTGDFVAAHRAGCHLCRQVTATCLPYRADIVLLDTYPANRDLWQSAEAICAGALAVRDGGTLIIVSPSPEGTSHTHPILLNTGYHPHAQIVRMAQSGQLQDLTGAGTLADISQLRDKFDCILVSPGIPRNDAQRLGFRSANSPQEALQLAFDRQGPAATIAVLRHGGHILPIADTRAVAAFQITNLQPAPYAPSPHANLPSDDLPIAPHPTYPPAP